jgi:RNA polymerase sigma-70 factor (ECF subfamily)
VAARAAVLAPADDATLVARHQAGDQAAFDELYHRHVKYIAGTVYRLMGGHGELPDILQETFLAALESLPDLRHPRTTMLRRLLSAGAPKASDPGDRMPVDDLGSALAGLAPKLRIPWILHHVEGETLPSVATIEGVSLATVKRRIARAELQIQRRTHGDA